MVTNKDACSVMASHDDAVLHSIWGGRMDSNHPCLLHDFGGVNINRQNFRRLSRVMLTASCPAYYRRWWIRTETILGARVSPNSQSFCRRYAQPIKLHLLSVLLQTYKLLFILFRKFSADHHVVIASSPGIVCRI